MHKNEHFQSSCGKNLDLCGGKLFLVKFLEKNSDLCERKVDTANELWQIGWAELCDVFPRIILNERYLTNTKTETHVVYHTLFVSYSLPL